jgi:hypothetical protein
VLNNAELDNSGTKAVVVKLVVLASAAVVLTGLVAAHALAGGDDPRAAADAEARSIIEASLAKPDLDSAVRASLNGKLASLDAEEKAKAEAPPSDVKAKAAAQPPKVEPTATPYTGIWDGANAPYPGWYAKVSNAWSGPTPRGRATVYAGHFVSDPKQAFLRVELAAGATAAVTSDVSLPRKTGDVRIVEFAPDSLTLAADDGSRWKFDLHAFVVSELP